MSKKGGLSLNRIRVPPGCILVNDKWRGTKLGQELCQKHGGIFSPELGLADFYPADKTAVLYFTTKEYAAKEHRKILRQFYDVYKLNCLIIADRNSETIGDYLLVQDFATFSLNLFVIPVVGPQEVPEMLKELSNSESKPPEDNPFRSRQQNLDLASTQISVLTLIPNLGRKKTQDLLKKFRHIQGVSEATEDELSKCVGIAAAKQVRRFFHRKLNT